MSEINEIERSQLAPRFTARLVVLEEPRIIERLNERALAHGHSLSSEVRSAIREHLSNEARP